MEPEVIVPIPVKLERLRRRWRTTTTRRPYRAQLFLPDFSVIFNCKGCMDRTLNYLNYVFNVHKSIRNGTDAIELIRAFHVVYFLSFIVDTRDLSPQPDYEVDNIRKFSSICTPFPWLIHPNQNATIPSTQLRDAEMPSAKSWPTLDKLPRTLCEAPKRFWKR